MTAPNPNALVVGDRVTLLRHGDLISTVVERRNGRYAYVEGSSFAFDTVTGLPASAQARAAGIRLVWAQKEPNQNG